MRTPETLSALVDHGIIDEVRRPLMSGKEAHIYLVESGGEARVAKIYKDAQNRSFQNRADYTEGRKVRNSRDQRAMGSRSKHGKAQNEAAWKSAEVDMIYRLREAGVRVPVPYHFIDGVLIMELVTDAEGFPAPRLGDLTLEPEEATEIFNKVLAEVVRMLCAGVVHGDLSDFNVLMSADGPVIIDFPQAVDASGNANARKLLLRDVDNLHRFHAKFAPQIEALPYAQEMWDLYSRNALTPDAVLTGKFRTKQKAVSTESVLDLIADADKDERRRREGLGLSMRGTSAPADESYGQSGPRNFQPAGQSARGPRAALPGQGPGQATRGGREERPQRDGSQPQAPRIERPQREGFQPQAPRNERPQREGFQPQAPRDERPQRDASSQAPRDARPQRDHAAQAPRDQREGFAQAPRNERPQREDFAQAPRNERPQREGFAQAPRNERPQRDDSSQAPRDERPQREGFAQAPRDERPQRDDSSQAPRDERPQREGFAQAPRNERPQRDDSTLAARDERTQRDDSIQAPRNERPQRGGFAQAPRNERPQREGFAQVPRDERAQREGSAQAPRDERAPAPRGERPTQDRGPSSRRDERGPRQPFAAQGPRDERPAPRFSDRHEHTGQSDQRPATRDGAASPQRNDRAPEGALRQERLPGREQRQARPELNPSYERGQSARGHGGREERQGFGRAPLAQQAPEARREQAEHGRGERPASGGWGQREDRVPARQQAPQARSQHHEGARQASRYAQNTPQAPSPRQPGNRQGAERTDRQTADRQTADRQTADRQTADRQARDEARSPRQGTQLDGPLTNDSARGARGRGRGRDS